MNQNGIISRRDFLKLALISSSSLVLGNYSINDSFAYQGKENIILTPSKILIPNLEKTINDYIKELRYNGVVSSDERTAWSVYDFQTKEKLVSINEDDRFQAASMIKPFVALAFFHDASKNRVTYTSSIKREIAKMIQKSNNSSTNKIMKILGGPRRIEQVLKKYYGDIFNEIEIVETIPTGKYTNGQTYRNKASVHDYSRFLYALWNNELPFSEEIKMNMAKAGKNRIYNGTTIPKGIEVYNKTGTTAMLCGDMAIFNTISKDGTKKAYTLVGVIEKENKAQNYFAWKNEKSSVIRGVSQIVYDNMKLRHDLI